MRNSRFFYYSCLVFHNEQKVVLHTIFKNLHFDWKIQVYAEVSILNVRYILLLDTNGK